MPSILIPLPKILLGVSMKYMKFQDQRMIAIMKFLKRKNVIAKDYVFVHQKISIS